MKVKNQLKISLFTSKGEYVLAKFLRGYGFLQTMSLFDEIKSKVPEKFHEREDFIFLLDTLRLGVFESASEIMELFDRDIKKINDWLGGNVMTGNVQEIAVQMKKLDKLKGAKSYLVDYLG